MPNYALDYNYLYLLLTVIVVFVALIVVLFLIIFIFIEFFSQRDNSKTKKIFQNAYNKAFSIVEDARKQSLHIIEDSNQKAQKLFNDSESFSQATKILLEKELKQTAERQFKSLDSTSKGLLEMYKKVIEQEEAKNIDTLEGVSKELKNELLSEVSEFKDLLHRETVESQQMIEQKINVEFRKALEEIDSYKKRKLKKVDDKIFTILVLVSKEVFGKILPVEDHQDIVMKALEAAKETQSFDSK